MRTRRAILLWLPVLAGCDAGAGGSFVPFAQASKIRPLAAETRKLVVTTSVGDVTITEATGAEMQIDAEVRVREGREDLQKAGKGIDDHVRVGEQDGVLTIEDAHRGTADGSAWSVSLRVALPRPLEVSADTSVGTARVTRKEVATVTLLSGTGNVELHADKVAGNVQATTGVGEVTARAAAVDGTISLKAGTGQVRLTIGERAPRGDVTASTGVGDVQVMLPRGAGGTFAALAGVGSISVDGLTGVTVSQTLPGASASGTVGEGGPKYTLSAGTGSVAVRAGE